MSIVWDETPHLVGALLIQQGNFNEYLMYSRYSPLVDIVISGFYQVFGSNVFAARLASVAFSILTIAAVFIFASKAYDRKIAFISCILLATMPGYVWISRVAMLEVSLEFFFVSALLLFLFWVRDGKSSVVILSGLMLGLAVLDKYQGVIAGVVMLAALPLLLHRADFKPKISKFSLLIVAAAAVVIPMLVLNYTSGVLDHWLALLQTSDTQTNVYSARFPTPFFYLFEMTYPVGLAHPVNILVFALGLLGLAFLVWRRKPEDKLLIAWFFIVYVFFTLIATKSWRYSLPLFPVIAITAANLLTFLYAKLGTISKAINTSANRRLASKTLAGLLIVFSLVAIAASAVDAYTWISTDATYVPLPESVHYAAGGFEDSNQSVLIVCGVNMFNQKAAEFYMTAYESKTNRVLVYPFDPADAFEPHFNASEMLTLCKANYVKYLFVYENHNLNYFNSRLNPGEVIEMMISSGAVYFDTTFGVEPNRIFVFQTNKTTIEDFDTS
jgi:4-amino-4-deoxy-L-arabinose transferase-like glycosyltransferase